MKSRNGKRDTFDGFTPEDVKKVHEHGVAHSSTLGKKPSASVKPNTAALESKSSIENVKEAEKLASPRPASHTTAQQSTNKSVDQTSAPFTGEDEGGTKEESLPSLTPSPSTASLAGGSLPSQVRELANLDEADRIKELNTKKKRELTRAIAERRKRTMKENDELREIQAELQKLDDLVGKDVRILRDRIETATLEYGEAQRAYHRIEREFVMAKTNLFSKAEIKERLTEHLHHIITNSEIRKADKLAELSEKFELLNEAELMPPE